MQNGESLVFTNREGAMNGSYINNLPFLVGRTPIEKITLNCMTLTLRAAALAKGSSTLAKKKA